MPEHNLSICQNELPAFNDLRKINEELTEIQEKRKKTKEETNTIKSAKDLSKFQFFSCNPSQSQAFDCHVLPENNPSISPNTSDNSEFSKTVIKKRDPLSSKRVKRIANIFEAKSSPAKGSPHIRYKNSIYSSVEQDANSEEDNVNKMKQPGYPAHR